MLEEIKDKITQDNYEVYEAIIEMFDNLNYKDYYEEYIVLISREDKYDIGFFLNQLFKKHLTEITRRIGIVYNDGFMLKDMFVITLTIMNLAIIEDAFKEEAIEILTDEEEITEFKLAKLLSLHTEHGFYRLIEIIENVDEKLIENLVEQLKVEDKLDLKKETLRLMFNFKFNEVTAGELIPRLEEIRTNYRENPIDYYIENYIDEIASLSDARTIARNIAYILLISSISNNHLEEYIEHIEEFMPLEKQTVIYSNIVRILERMQNND